MGSKDIALADFSLSKEDLRKAEEFRRSKNTSVLVIVFADMERSAQLRENLGEVQFELVRDRMMQVLQDTITEGGDGIIIKNTGDGVLAIFAEPSTAAERGVAIQNQLYGDPYISVRIGMDMGQVAVERKGGLTADAFGRHVNRAARVTDLTEGGHILTTGPVWDSAEGWLRPTWYAHHVHGLHKVRGVPKPLDMHEVYNANITTPIKRLKAPRTTPQGASQRRLPGYFWAAAALVSIVAIVVAVVLWGDRIFPGGEKTTATTATTTVATPASTTTYAAGTAAASAIASSAAPDTVTTTSPWQARASHNQVEVSKAFDGNPDTVWDSETAQQLGMWYELDLGQIQTIERIKVESPGQGFATAYILSVSTDRTDWEVVNEMTENWKSIDTSFPPRSVRYIKIEQTGSPNWGPRWLISEIDVSMSYPKE